jgi:transcriptional regulatory protein RtcR
MATLATSGRIDETLVREEITRLRGQWQPPATAADDPLVELLGARIDQLDRFDRVQLADVVTVCRQSRTLSEAGRALFQVSRQARKTANDADRLQKYLARFDLTWDDVR